MYDYGIRNGLHSLNKGVVIWEKLPIPAQESRSLEVFKLMIKKWKGNVI